MKYVILFRHAKSDWNAEHTSDRERQLSKRGRKAARRMGQMASARPDLVLTSPAVRARESVALAAQAGAWAARVEVVEQLYGGGSSGALEVVRAQSDEASVLLLAGHEPGWSELAGSLVGGARLRMPTAAMACVELACDTWAAVEPGVGTLLWLVTPKSLRGKT